MKNSTSLKIIL